MRAQLHPPHHIIGVSKHPTLRKRTRWTEGDVLSSLTHITTPVRLSLTMSVAALSPVAPEPMLTSVTPGSPALEHASPTSVPLSLDPDGGSSPGLRSDGAEPQLGGDACRRSSKPPPLHTIADWKVVLHLPEIQTWLRATSHRVTQLTHSVGQDAHGRHVDVHLVQLKDICEDISDHVEQIHALLETEFTLKLLSYSVNIIVDIRTVQLLWHQLRVSVLVLKERLLQSLQDSNGNFTRQTDILQAFSEDQHQTRLDALTEVDDCGQLTIRCSQDYFSLDCGITAFELSDYSPGEEPGGRGAELKAQETSRDVNQEPEERPEPSGLPNLNLRTGWCDVAAPGDASQQAVGLSTEAPPRPPSPPRRAALLSDGGTQEPADISGLQLQAEMSRSTPSVADRTRFWLELDSVYPDNVSQSCENLQVLNRRNLQANLSRPPGESVKSRSEPRSCGASAHSPLLLEEPATQDTITQRRSGSSEEAHVLSEDDSGSSLPSPVRTQYFSSDMEASGEESEPRPAPVWIGRQQGQKGAPVRSPEKQHWYGSEEFLALPAQLRKTEMLALKLESLARSIPLGRGDPTQEALQDVDDWDLMEVNSDGDLGDGNAPSPPSQFPSRRNHRHFSSASSSDTGPSLDGSIESGPLSDLQSDEDEGRRSADHYLQLAAPPLGRPGGASLAVRLLEDVRNRDKDPDVWKRVECLVRQLDGFISWLQEALDSTDNWTQPRQDVDSLRVYLDTHLSFKLSVDSRSALKESIMEEGSALLSVITSHQSGLKDILQMVSSQWDQLQRQIRRQHSWMLRALRCVQARLLYTHPQSQEPSAAAGGAAANQRPPQPPDSLMAELVSNQYDAQRVALETMAVRLSSLQYPAATDSGQSAQYARNNSLQQCESDYQELWDWLMDMDAMVTDSHQLMMSEEQRRQLFKSSRVELTMMESKKSSLLRRSRRHGNLQHKIHQLTHTWEQLEAILSEPSGSGCQPSLLDRDVLENPGSSSSSLSNALLEQLEARVKELKVWLRDTELLIFNSCLREHKDAAQQLHSFKCLSSEVRARRRGVSSVLKLCQKLLQVGVGPEAEQHREALQLLSINLERRWEAIVMQALQWESRLRRELGEEQVPGKVPEPGLARLLRRSPVPAGPEAHLQDDSWEWDETDMSFSEVEPLDLLKDSLRPQPAGGAPAPPPAERSSRGPSSTLEAGSQPDRVSSHPPSTNVLQVFSLHSVELDQQPPPGQAPSPWSKPEKLKQHLLLKSLSKDSSFSSLESLPERLASSWHSGSESGIVSDTGDTETSSSEAQGEAGPENRDRSPRGDASRLRRAPTEEEKMEMKVAESSEEHRFRASGPLGSQASSLESVLVLDEELFPAKDLLPRCSSLESCLLPAHTSHGETGGEPGERSKDGGAEGGPSSQELSRRTLELLRRLEDIQTPLTRSLSDLALQRSHLARSPRRLPASSQEEPAVQESEDSSHLRHHPRVSSATTHGSSGKRCHGNGGGGVDEADAASVSLLVNVSCTEEEQDDSDLLTSSTLTLTEEELGFQEDEEEGLSSASLEEEEEDGPYLLGLDYLKTELQSFIRAPRASSSKPDRRLLDELQCGASLSSTSSTQSSEQQSHTNSNLEEHHQEDHQENQRNRTRSFISRLVDDVENGNVEQSSSRSEEEEDDRLLREESSVFTRRGAAPREEAYVFLRPAGFPPDVPSCTSNAGAPPQELHPFAHKRSSSLVGQLKGELPCHSSSCSSPLQDHKPDDAVQRSASLAAGRTAITIQETFKFSSVVMEEAKREVREVGTAPPPRGRRRCPPGCSSHAPSPSPLQEDNVHDFVMEIIDMTSTALRSKGQAEGASQDAGGAQDQAPPLTHIRDKVLELSHRPLHLRQGDFYAYLSLSSHDSDCGELTQRATPTPHSDPAHATPTQALETFTSEAPPLSPGTRDQESLFPACTEEVYLGPPLCYSLTLAKGARRGGVSSARSRSRPERPPSDPQASSSEEAHHSSSSWGCSVLRMAPPLTVCGAAAERRGEQGEEAEPSGQQTAHVSLRQETTCGGIRSLQDAALRGLS